MIFYEYDRGLERHVMAYYLQPGGARNKLSSEERQTFLFKVKNLSKSVIAQCLNEALVSADNSIVMVSPYIINRKE